MGSDLSFLLGGDVVGPSDSSAANVKRTARRAWRGKSACDAQRACGGASRRTWIVGAHFRRVDDDGVDAPVLSVRRGCQRHSDEARTVRPHGSMSTLCPYHLLCDETFARVCWFRPSYEGEFDLECRLGRNPAGLDSRRTKSNAPL